MRLYDAYPKEVGMKYELAEPDKYYINIVDRGFVECTGKPVAIYPELDLFSIKGADVRGEMYDRPKWIVSEGMTGARLAIGETRRQAIRDTETKISERGIKKVYGYRNQLIEEFGLSPRYRKVK